MPDYPLINNDEANRAKLQPRKATANPTLDKAIAQLERIYPADMLGTKVNSMSWDSPYIGSNVAGSTNTDSGDVEINPFITTAFPQGLTEQTLAHELQHVRQHRTSGPVEHLKNLMLGYDERPEEKEARTAANSYNTLMGVKGNWESDPSVFNYLPKRLK